MTSHQQRVNALISSMIYDTSRTVRYDYDDGCVYAVDAIRVLTGCDARESIRLMKQIEKTYGSEIFTTTQKFPERGQRPTPACDSSGLAELVVLLPGPQIALLRHKFAQMFCMILANDEQISPDSDYAFWRRQWDIVNSIHTTAVANNMMSSAESIRSMLANITTGLPAIRYDPITRNLSIIDVIRTVTGRTTHGSLILLRSLMASHYICPTHMTHKFPGHGQHDIPVGCTRVITEILILLPGEKAARLRAEFAGLMRAVMLGGFHV